MAFWHLTFLRGQSSYKVKEKRNAQKRVHLRAERKDGEQ